MLRLRYMAPRRLCVADDLSGAVQLSRQYTHGRSDTYRSRPVSLSGSTPHRNLTITALYFRHRTPRPTSREPSLPQSCRARRHPAAPQMPPQRRPRRPAKSRAGARRGPSSPHAEAPAGAQPPTPRPLEGSGADRRSRRSATCQLHGARGRHAGRKASRPPSGAGRVTACARAHGPFPEAPNTAFLQIRVIRALGETDHRPRQGHGSAAKDWSPR
eukprot:scaffold1594_cov401-Prasinococcus_capsulatus_cf.AAC.56